MPNTATNKVKFGLSNVHYAVVTEGETPTFGAWKSLPTAISLNVSENSNTAQQYADDQLLYVATSTTSTTLGLEMSVVSDEFKKDVLGYLESSRGGLVQIVNDVKKKIALGFEVKGDAKHARHVFFVCEVNNIDEGDHSTNTESPTFANDTINLTAYPVALTNGKYAIKERIDEGQSGYATLFTNAFTLPTFTV